MKIKKRFPDSADINQFDVKNRADIESIEWVKETWMKYPEFNLVWNYNPGIIDCENYPTLIMAQGIFESGKKETHAIFLCEGNAADLGLDKWNYNTLKNVNE
jgi:hypothetical protein